MNFTPSLKLIKAYLESIDHYLVKYIEEYGIELNSVSLEEDGDLICSLSGEVFGAFQETIYIPLLDLLAFVWESNQ